MNDRIFYPLILALIALMVFLALRPGIGRLPDGPVTGDGQNYGEITIEGKYLNKIHAGGEAKSRLIRENGQYEVYIEVEEGALSEDPVLGPHFRLASDLETQYSGFILDITVRARPAEDRGAMQMRVNYSAGRVGESGWQVFDLKPGYNDYTFQYRVPVASGEQGLDYLAIRPVVPEKVRALYIDKVTFRRLGRWPNQEASLDQNG